MKENEVCHSQQQGWKWRTLSEIDQAQKDKYYKFHLHMKAKHLISKSQRTEE